MKKQRRKLLIAATAVLAGSLLAACGRNEVQVDSSKESVPEEKVGDVYLLNGFETMDDLYAVKQTNFGYDTVGKMDISAEQKTEGEHSLKYSYEAGANPEILQRFDQSQYPQADMTTVGKTSLSVYSTAESAVTATLKVITTGNIVLLSSEAYEIQPGEWTEISFDIDAFTRTKNKDDIVGISVSLGVKGVVADYYIDNWTITIGEPVTDEQIAQPVVDRINALPAAEDVDTLAEIMSVLSANGSYEALSESVRAKVSNYDKLAACMEKTEGYGLLFDAGSRLFSMITTSGAGWDWTATMNNVADETYGSAVEINVISYGSGMIIEMNHGAFENAGDYDQIIFYVYNPMDADKTLIYATGQGWSGKSTTKTLKAGEWTEIIMSMNDVNAEGGYFLIQNSLANGWKFSSIIGVKSSKRAQEVIDLIAALPEVDVATEANVEAIQQALDAYDALTDGAKALVSNFDKLNELAGKVLYGKYAEPVMAAIDALPETVSSIADIEAINEAKDLYDSTLEEAKAYVTNVDKLEEMIMQAQAYQNSIDAVRSLIGSVEGKADTDEEIWCVLSAKSIYESLPESEQAKLTGDDLAAYTAAVEATEGYSILYDARTESLLTSPAPGDFTNTSQVRNTLDGTYGNVFALKVLDASAHSAMSFKPYGSLDTNGIAAVMFYIKNDTGAWQNMLAAYTSDWTNSIAQQLPGQWQIEDGDATTIWSKVIIPVDKFYALNDVFFVLNNAGPNFEGDTDHPVTMGTWMISGFVGITQDKYNELLAADTVAMIEELPDASEVKDLTYRAKITAAKNSYDALDEGAKAKVTNAEKLNACVEALNRVFDGEAEKIDEMIAALPAASEITADNCTLYRTAIMSANNAYVAAVAEVQERVTGYEKLEACMEKLSEFAPAMVKALIEALPDAAAIDTETEILQVLSVKGYYDSLTAEEKALVENVEKLNACVVKAEGYKLLVDPLRNSSGIRSGSNTGNPGTVGTTVDETYGALWTLQVTNDANGDFQPVGLNAGNYAFVTFNIYNPTGTDIDLVLYDGAWGNQKVVASLKSKSWTEVRVDVSVYGSNFFFIFNSAACSGGIWKITGFMGVPAEDGNKVILDASVAGNLRSGSNTGNPGTVGTAVDETYGDVWTLQVTKDANGDFQPVGLNVDGYAFVTFSIYNPTGTDIDLVLYDGDWGNQKVVASLKSKSWTEVRVDVSVYGSNFFFIFNSAACSEGMWKITSFVGEPAEDRNKVILDASVAANLRSGSNTGNPGTVGTAVDETYGDVWTLQVTKDANGDFQPVGLNADGYAFVTFSIYNPTGEDIGLVLYDGKWGNQKVVATMKSKEWTEVSVDVSVYGSDFFFILNSAACSEGIWKITSFVGVPDKETPDSDGGAPTVNAEVVFPGKHEKLA